MEAVSNSAFYNCPELTVFCCKYSKLFISFIDQNIDVISYNDNRTIASSIINDRLSIYEAKNMSGTIFICNYYIDQDKFNSTSNRYIKIKIPNGAVIASGSLYYNDELCIDYKDYTEYITIPISKNSGKISFKLTFSGDYKLVTYATFNYTQNNNSDFDIIDVINNDIPVIAVYSESVTSSDMLHISGIGPASFDIDVSVDENYVTTVRSNKVGSFSLDVPLPDPVDNTVYKIEVSTDYNGTLIKDAVSVKYQENAPEMQSFIMKYKGITYDLMSQNRYSISLVPNRNYSFHFEVVFSNPENIGSVYISSVKNQVTKTVEALWDESTQTYIFDGFFDDNNLSYVPGNISARYVSKNDDYEESTIEDYEEILEGASVTEILNTENEVSVDIAFSNGDVWHFTEQRNVSVSELEEEFFLDENSNQDEILYASSSSSVEEFITKLTQKYGEKVATNLIIDNIEESSYLEAYFQDDDRGSVYHVFYDPVTKVITKQAIKYAVGGTAYQISRVFTKNLYVPYKSALKAGGVVVSAGQTLVDYNGQMVDVAKVDTQIRNSKNLSESQKRGYLRELNTARNAYTMIAAFNLATTCAGTLLLGPVGGAIFGIVTGVISGLVKDEADKLLDLVDTGTNSKMNFLMDPSGYVYEAVTTNRIPNAIVTTYWIPFEEDDDDFWQEPDETKAIIWDAGEYSQENPVYTDSNGNYAWDVPEGWWKVIVEKEGYDTYTTGWMPVPPPQTDINIGMSSLEKTAVTFVGVYDDRVQVTFNQYMDPESLSGVEIVEPSGSSVSYRLVFSTNETDASGKVYAQSFSFFFDESYEVDKTGVYTITLGQEICNYAGKHFDGEEIIKEYDKERSIVLQESIIIPYKGCGWVLAECHDFDGDELLEGFSAYSDIAEILAVSNITDGIVAIAIKGNKIGQTPLTITVAGTSIRETINVKVTFASSIPNTVPAPTGFTAIYDDDQGVVLSWNANEEIAYYEVYRQNPENLVFYQIGSTDSKTLIDLDVLQGTYVLVGRTQDGTYSDLSEIAEVVQSGHEHIWNEEHIIKKEPTCTEPGLERCLFRCSVCEKTKEESEVEVPPKGHDYDNPYWTWADNYSTATVTLICNNDRNHKIALTGIVTSKTTLEASYTTIGEIMYTAVAEYGENTYQDQNTETIPKLAPIGFTEQGLNWEVKEGVLTISLQEDAESTEIPDYAVADDAPWSNAVKELNVSNVVVEEGITKIGSNAFTGLDGVNEINLPRSLTELAEDSIHESALSTVKINYAGTQSEWDLLTQGTVFNDVEITSTHKHTWDSGKVTKPATTAATGVKTYRCSCGTTKTESIPRLKIVEKITISKKPTIKKPAVAKGKITVKWKHFKHTSKSSKKIWKKIKKVQVQCAIDSGFKNIVKDAMTGRGKTKYAIKGLKKKTKYYVRVRYFDGTGYSAWSKVKSVKTK